MPLITIHTSSKEQTDLLVPILDELKAFAANELTCNTRSLDKSEISVRISMSDASHPISEIEVVIIAYSYDKRVRNVGYEPASN